MIFLWMWYDFLGKLCATASLSDVSKHNKWEIALFIFLRRSSISVPAKLSYSLPPPLQQADTWFVSWKMFKFPPTLPRSALLPSSPKYLSVPTSAEILSRH